MIRVDIEEVQGRGVYRYRVAGTSVEGQSRQPLLAACRQIKALYGPSRQTAGAFRKGRTEPDHWCSVEWGAGHTVCDPSNGRIHFHKFDPSWPSKAAELNHREASDVAPS
jgi:hypothetical protein